MGQPLTTNDLRTAAQQRFLHDPEFHARVYLAVRVIEEVRHLDPDALAAATTAACISAHLSDTGIDAWFPHAAQTPPPPIIRPH